MAKKLFIKTWGCQMNVYDSTRMADVLAPLGYEPTDSAEGADMVIFNTCHIRENASEKVFSDLGRLKPLRDAAALNGRRMMIGVAGCVAQAQGALIAERAPFVDMVFGPQAYHRLPELVARVARAAGETVLDTDFPAETKFDSLPEEHTQVGPAAFLAIQEGCDKFCAYCVVPYTRGAEYSRGAVGILAEARHLAARGAREITLLGQNVNAWHGEARHGGLWDLARLIRELADILPNGTRLRYTTSHPSDMTDSLILAHAEVPALMPFLHLPVQSGSDRVLKAMNRQHTAADYVRIIERLRSARPNLALSSDFIVGHPGETDEDFEATLSLVREVGYAQAYSFKYSPRPGTPAAALPQVTDAVKVARLAALQDLLLSQARAFNDSCVGTRMSVLFDRPGKRPGQLLGRSPFMQSVHATLAQDSLGTVIGVTITKATANSLSGQPV